jgi:hypothetical protein
VIAWSVWGFVSLTTLDKSAFGKAPVICATVVRASMASSYPFCSVEGVFNLGAKTVLPPLVQLKVLLALLDVNRITLYFDPFRLLS